jgi:hypothetical protein
MTDLKEKYKSLVRKLYERTILGASSWELGFNNELSCSLSSYDVHLKTSRDADGEPLEIIELRNSSDQVIDSFDDTDIAELVSGYTGIDNYFQLMRALRISARRQALGADKALDAILKTLEDDF